MVRTYNILAPVYFGARAIRETGEICRSLGVKKALIVTEKSLLSLGLPQKRRS